MKKLMAAVAVAVALTAVTANAADFDLKGYQLGTRFDETKLASSWRCQETIELGKFCMDRISFGVDDNARVVVVFTPVEPYGIRSVSTYFAETHFETTLQAMILKYGQPTSVENGVVTNRMGAKFDAKKVVWKNAAGDSLTLNQRSGSLDRSSVSLMSKQTLDDYNSNKAKKASAVKGNL